jgi:hypothetical protein
VGEVSPSRLRRKKMQTAKWYERKRRMYLGFAPTDDFPKQPPIEVPEQIGSEEEFPQMVEWV